MNAPVSSPVRGFEVLAWSGDHAQVHDDLRAQRVRLARLGDEDALVVYATRVGPKDVLWSRRIAGAFTRWPPAIGPAVEHQSGQFFNSTSALVAWPDGSFAVRTQEGTIVATADTPGASWSFRGAACFEPAPLEGMYLFAPEEGQTKLLHRSRRAEDAHVTPCGVAPPATHHVVTELGTLVFARLEKDGACQLHVATREGVRAGGRLQGPPGSMGYLLARRGGGAFVVLGPHRGDVVVQRVDEGGHLVGAPLVHVSEGALYAACAWNDGFALQLRGAGGLTAAVSDGVSTTLVHAGLVMGQAGPHGREGALVASPSGSVVLFGYESMAGPSLGRLVAGGPETLERVVPPTIDLSKLPAMRPVPPRSPETPAAYVPPKFGTRDELVAKLRYLGFSALLSGLRGEYVEALLTGDANAGSFYESDGQGNHCFVLWDATGVVALGFDHESPESEWSVERDQRAPEKHLLRVPPGLKALATRAADAGERLATEGFWVEAGEQPKHAASRGDVLDQLLPKWPVPKDDLARIIAVPSYEITSEEGRSILSQRRVPGAVLSTELVGSVSKRLAKLGITWPTAREDALAQARLDEAAREARLAPADRALLVAAHAGDLDGVKRALADGASIDVPMPYEELPFTPARATPLLVALRGEHRAVVEHLLELGADVNATAASGWAGVMTPLRVVAAQGNAELTRLLLARGASVRPEEANWGILQQVTYPEPGRPQGTPADYAEVIRMLLDAGAPLPNDAHCSSLARMVVAGGAPELERRVRRVHAEDALPEEPEPVDTAANAPRVSELLARAAGALSGDTVESLRALVEAWRLSLNPRIGDAAEGLARMVRGGARPAIATGDRPANADALVAAVKATGEGTLDPRAARALFAWLWTTDIYTSKAAIAKAEDEAAAALVILRDVRFTESLALFCELGRPISSVAVRESLKFALRVMKAVVPGALSEADVDHLGVIEDHLASRKPTGARPTVRDLFEAVYDAGHDAVRGDEARRALAARLTEAGDPRGELITLQMSRRAGKVTKREKELLSVHGRAWLGEIGPLIEDGFVFERGFVTEARVIGGASGGPWYRVLPTGAGTQRAWSTLRCLRLAGHESPGLLGGSETQAIPELLDVGRGHLDALVSGPSRPGLRRLELAAARTQYRYGREPNPDPSWRALPEKLPALERLAVALRGDGLDAVEELVGRLPKLRQLGVGSEEPALAELVALARRRGLAKVDSVGLTDLSFTLESGLLEIAFNDVLRPKHASLAEEALASASALGIEHVVVRLPPRAKLALDGKGRPKKLERRAESLPLWPILEAVESLGLTCEFDPPG